MKYLPPDHLCPACGEPNDYPGRICEPCAWELNEYTKAQARDLLEGRSGGSLGNQEPPPGNYLVKNNKK